MVFGSKERNQTIPLLNHIKGNTSRFGSATQLLPSEIRTLAHFWLLLLQLFPFLHLFSATENCFFVDVNSVRMSEKKLTWLDLIHSFLMGYKVLQSVIYKYKYPSDKISWLKLNINKTNIQIIMK